MAISLHLRKQIGVIALRLPQVYDVIQQLTKNCEDIMITIMVSLKPKHRFLVEEKMSWDKTLINDKQATKNATEVIVLLTATKNAKQRCKNDPID